MRHSAIRELVRDATGTTDHKILLGCIHALELRTADALRQSRPVGFELPNGLRVEADWAGLPYGAVAWSLHTKPAEYHGLTTAALVLALKERA